MRNTRNIKESVENYQLTGFSLRLKESGYPGKMRREMIKKRDRNA